MFTLKYDLPADSNGPIALNEPFTDSDIYPGLVLRFENPIEFVQVERINPDRTIMLRRAPFLLTDDKTASEHPDEQRADDV